MSGPHANGKGSNRRPAAISEEQLAENWEAVFGKRRPRRTAEQIARLVEIVHQLHTPDEAPTDTRKDSQSSR